jgi:D-alanyl-D-alanine dipeptidase
MLFSTSCFALPNGFVYLRDIDPTIKAELRYTQTDNFLGRPVTGYNHIKSIIITKEAAIALKKAQEIFKRDGFSIVIYDAYRPQRAVNSFINWAKEITDQKQKSLFYPRVDKSKVFELGYIAEKSSHSRGSTADLTIIELKKNLHPIKPIPRKLLDGFEILYLEDGTVDMGTSFDLFDKASHYENNLISDEHKQRRTYLKNVMESCGFQAYPEEWWHFTLDNEPFPDTYWDFVE